MMKTGSGTAISPTHGSGVTILKTTSCGMKISNHTGQERTQTNGPMTTQNMTTTSCMMTGIMSMILTTTISLRMIGTGIAITAGIGSMIMRLTKQSCYGKIGTKTGQNLNHGNGLIIIGTGTSHGQSGIWNKQAKIGTGTATILMLGSMILGWVTGTSGTMIGITNGMVALAGPGPITTAITISTGTTGNMPTTTELAEPALGSSDFSKSD